MLLLVLERALSNGGSHGFSVYPFNVTQKAHRRPLRHAFIRSKMSGRLKGTNIEIFVGRTECEDAMTANRDSRFVEFDTFWWELYTPYKHTLGCALIVVACVYAISLSSEYGWAIYLDVQLLLCDVWCARECMCVCVCVRLWLVTVAIYNE